MLARCARELARGGPAVNQCARQRLAALDFAIADRPVILGDVGWNALILASTGAEANA